MWGVESVNAGIISEKQYIIYLETTPNQ